MKRRRTRGCVDFTLLPCHQHLSNTGLGKGIHEFMLSPRWQRSRRFTISNPPSLTPSINEYSRKLLQGGSAPRISEESISGKSHSFIFHLASLFGPYRKRWHQFQRFAKLSETHVCKERITFTFALWLFPITIAGEIPQSAPWKDDYSLLYFFLWPFLFLSFFQSAANFCLNFHIWLRFSHSKQFMRPMTFQSIKQTRTSTFLDLD